MKKILLLLLLTVLFAGCKKDDEGKNENYRIAGKWVLYHILVDGMNIKCNTDKLIDEFGEDGKYFGFLPNGTNIKQSYATYVLKGEELKIYEGDVEKKFKILELSNSSLIIVDVSLNAGACYSFIK